MRLLVLAALLCACNFRVGEGRECERDKNCREGLRCIDGTCQIPPETEAEMARQSGVELPTEKPAANGPAKPGAVKVRSVTNKPFAIATCAADERLVGGWCRGTGGRAEGYSASDTIGARWRCIQPPEYDGEVTAFAMCQKLE